MFANVLKSENRNGIAARKDWSRLEAYGLPSPSLPFENGNGTNLHAYVGADPINFTDPSGLQHHETVVGRRVDGPGAPMGSLSGGLFGNGAQGTGAGAAEYAAELRQGPFAAPPCTDNCNTAVVIGRRPQPRDVRRQVLRAAIWGLGRLAEWLEPPEPRQEGESFGQCWNRIAGPNSVALTIEGGMSVGAGGAWLGYPRVGISGGGQGTSLISYAARTSLGQTPVGGQYFGTGGLGGVAGRGLSRISVAGGAGLGGYAVGTMIGAVQRCQ